MLLNIVHENKKYRMTIYIPMNWNADVKYDRKSCECESFAGRRQQLNRDSSRNGVLIVTFKIESIPCLFKIFSLWPSYSFPRLEKRKKRKTK